MEEFMKVSGLSMNRNKTELLIDGGSSTRCRDLAERVEIAQGSLPVRYLGVLLSSRMMKKANFQLFLDKVTTRFRSWTVNHLSYAGRLVLVKVVIYSIITFGRQFLSCQGTVWMRWSACVMVSYGKGTLLSARGAKVYWVSVCTPKICGGLGLKRIAEWNQVLALKLV